LFKTDKVLNIRVTIQVLMKILL